MMKKQTLIILLVLCLVSLLAYNYMYSINTTSHEGFALIDSSIYKTTRIRDMIKKIHKLVKKRYNKERKNMKRRIEAFAKKI